MRRVIPVIFAAALVGLTIACSGGRNVTPSATSTPTSAPATPTPLAHAIAANPAELLQAIATAMNDAGNWRVDATMLVRESAEAEEPVLVTAVTAVRTADGNNIVVTNTSVSYGMIQGDVPSENRRVDGVNYRRDPNTGDWMLGGSNDYRPSLTVDAAVIGRIDPSTVEATEDTLAGERVFRLIGSAPGEPAATGVVVWVGVDDLLVRRILMEGTAPVSNFVGLLPGLTGDLPQSVDVAYFAVGRDAVVRAPSMETEAVETPHGTMARYHSATNPFSLQYPAGWRSELSTDVAAASFLGSGQGLLMITEEYMDIRPPVPGMSITLDDYTEMVLANLGMSVEGFEMVSTRPITTDGGLEANVIEMAGGDGTLRASRLIYVHDGAVGFGATYAATAQQYESLQDIIDYSFRSFRVEG